MKVSIIIPNYNGEKLLEKNLQIVSDAASYFRTKTGNTYEIILIDDHSSDNSLKVIRDFSKTNQVKIIENEKNLGFSSSVNRAVENSEGEILVLLNTDTRPDVDFLLPLLKHFEREDVFAVGCLDKSIEKGKVVLRGRGIGRWQKGFLTHSKGEISQKNTLWVSGGSGAFRKSIWNRLGGLFEIYNPFYWEDLDISYRALKAGYVILFEPESKVTHEHELGVINRYYSKERIKEIAYRNQFIFIWINITDLDFQFAHILWLPYHLIKGIMRGDFALIKGFFLSFILLPKVIQLSFKAQRFFKMGDKELISRFKR